MSGQRAPAAFQAPHAPSGDEDGRRPVAARVQLGEHAVPVRLAVARARGELPKPTGVAAVGVADNRHDDVVVAAALHARAVVAVAHGPHLPLIDRDGVGPAVWKQRVAQDARVLPDPVAGHPPVDRERARPPRRCRGPCRAACVPRALAVALTLPQRDERLDLVAQHEAVTHRLRQPIGRLPRPFAVVARAFDASDQPGREFWPDEVRTVVAATRALPAHELLVLAVAVALNACAGMARAQRLAGRCRSRPP